MKLSIIRVLSVALFLGLCFGVFRVSDHYAAKVFAVEKFDLALQDTTGSEWQPEKLGPRHAVFYFGYTYCPDVCPTALLTLTDAIAGSEESARDFLPIFVTIDPERDTAEHVGLYISNFSEDIVGLVGPIDRLEQAAAHLGITYRSHKSSPDDQDYLVDHSSKFVLMDSEGRWTSIAPLEDPEKLMLLIRNSVAELQ